MDIYRRALAALSDSDMNTYATDAPTDASDMPRCYFCGDPCEEWTDWYCSPECAILADVYSEQEGD